MKGYFEDNHFDNIFGLFDVCQILISPQVNRWEVITYKHGVYELPNELRLGNLGN